MEHDLDVLAVPGEGFVDGVVDDFVDEVVQPGGRGVADVHAGILTDVRGILQGLHVVFGVLALRGEVQFWRLLWWPSTQWRTVGDRFKTQTVSSFLVHARSPIFRSDTILSLYGTGSGNSALQRRDYPEA